MLHVSKAEVLERQHRIELLEEEERERTTPIVVFDYGFLTQENEDTFPILICLDSRYGQTGGDTRSHSVLHFISCWYHQRSWFSQSHLEMR